MLFFGVLLGMVLFVPQVGNTLESVFLQQTATSAANGVGAER
jgi:hypothetical protein